MDEFLFWPAWQLKDEIANRRLSAIEVTQAALNHIETFNPSINAVVQLCAERALDEARACDQMTASGETSGPLHGVPMTLKDSLDTQDVISTGGTRGREKFVPECDAPVAARLRAAGAILLGKTNTPELTLSGETENLIYGRTSNPYDLERSPGGSSGGSAAAIASGFSAVEIGSDTGGSIREPAHYCGIAGIKPTSGRTPRTGHIVPYGMGAVDSLTQLGPMARTVEDLRIVLPIVCGPDYEDPSVIDVAVRDPRDVDLKSLRIAAYTDNGVTKLDADVRSAIEDAVNALTSDGYNVSWARPPGLERSARALSKLREADGGTIIRRLLTRWGTDEPGPHMTYCFNGPPAVSGDEYAAVIEEADSCRSQMLGFLRDYDAIVCPTSRHVAPRHGSTLDETFLMWSYSTVYNLTGWPGAVVRAGTSKEGLPIGAQIVAGPWREDVALALAARLETLLGGFTQPVLRPG